MDSCLLSKGNVTVKERLKRCNIAGFQEGGVKGCGWIQEAGKIKETDSPQVLPEMSETYSL